MGYKNWHICPDGQRERGEGDRGRIAELLDDDVGGCSSAEDTLKDNLKTSLQLDRLSGGGGDDASDDPDSASEE